MKCLLLFLALSGLVLTGRSAAAPIQSHSKWDENILNLELGEVGLDFSGSFLDTWGFLSSGFHLHANIYMDAASAAAKARVRFKSPAATERLLLEAFLTNYPAYTYTQDPKSGVVWIHPKVVSFDSILSQRIGVADAAPQVLMLDGILKPLLPFLPALWQFEGNQDGEAMFNYGVDLPAGIFPVRELLDRCCIANPEISFVFRPLDKERMMATVKGSYSPFSAADRYWESEVGSSTHAAPDAEAIRAALADPNPARRAAARHYVAMTPLGRNWNPLLQTNNDEAVRQSAWVLLAIRNPDFPSAHPTPAAPAPGPRPPRPGNDGPPPTPVPPLSETGWLMHSFTNSMPKNDPGLALLIAMELAREQNDTSVLDCVAGHKFTPSEIAVIKPDVYRMTRGSKTLRDKLIQMKLDAPELSPTALQALARTTLFTLIPPLNQN